MELTYHTDYALRTLIYLAMHPERLCSIAEVAERYEISENHLMKVVHGLGRGGFVTTYRGKGGGLALARPPHLMRIGDIVNHTEGPFRPVECFKSGSRCAIEGACTLPAILSEAFAAFAKTLNRYTLADLLRNRSALARRLRSPARAAAKGRAPARAIVIR